MPARGWRVTLGGKNHARATLRLELGVRLLEEEQQLLGHCTYVLCIDQRERQLHRPPAYGDVRILQALQNGGAMPLHRRRVRVHRSQQRVQRHVPNVLVRVEQETSQNIDSQDAQSTLRAGTENGEAL